MKIECLIIILEETKLLEHNVEHGKDISNKPLTSQATCFYLMDDISPTLTPPNPFVHNQITMNIKPTWMSTHKVMTHAI